MLTMSLREIVWIVDSVCTLCMEHEWAGVVGGREGRNLVETEINKSSRQAEMITAISTWHYTIIQMFITKSLACFPSISASMKSMQDMVR